ncbi:MAG: aspartate aminotransferase family protein [Phenylobacterium sp.]|uniref:aspartate aminotransferase family protein n=1 Tax=Phenylobacterium sp. TaxID=1871053 RepID=UPI0025F0163D|nr:aspartate aminotransferase family protein [Phenylobacterium sp.]MCA3711432.1 aspartate aminotransferase family protein [Phenylobacterium sp.]MCA6230245.1 aspartate aminotransferase family protein [Phenylobacterium sp.]MCA6242018.1 aspartate aminotransferase family protein [Phenylobacterium sp.]MCA6259526.1 aspartate aminotransferase family protein [Phenylobacterium sp.]MCE2820381.1 aspartate aminotransferase family protein [Phenylobacterium sp.]
MSADYGDNRPDLTAFWMPFTANRQYKDAPRLLVEASGMHYRTLDGDSVLDGTAGLWCCNLGHAREEITEAVSRQLATLDFAPTFQMGHPLPFRLAAALAEVAPPGLDRIFFTNSGSESVDTALKMALAYHRARGEGQRVRLIGREKGYHGVGFGGISVGGLVNNRRTYLTLPGADHIAHTFDIERNAFSRGLPDHGAEKADEIERLVALHGAETIAAVIVEPVAGSAGVLPPPKGYLERLRTVCDRHGILLIFDEVITGFGRLGEPFAAQALGVTPDIMTTAKGITNGALPMGAVFAHRKVHDAIVQGPPAAIEFFHGYTYSGHPVACAAALASLEVYRRDGLFTRVKTLAGLWEDSLHALRGKPNVIDIRNIGLMGAIELAPRPDAPGARGYEVLVKALKAGLLVRATGDIIALSPPLIISEAQIGQLFDILGGVLDDVA